jgi:hypothetical protein
MLSLTSICSVLDEVHLRISEQSLRSNYAKEIAFLKDPYETIEAYEQLNTLFNKSDLLFEKFIYYKNSKSNKIYVIGIKDFYNEKEVKLISEYTDIQFSKFESFRHLNQLGVQHTIDGPMLHRSTIDEPEASNILDMTEDK